MSVIQGDDQRSAAIFSRIVAVDMQKLNDSNMCGPLLFNLSIINMSEYTVQLSFIS